MEGVLGNFNSDAEFLENTSDPGRAISGFTYGDLRGGNIFYVHRGHLNSWILLRARDGELVSNTVVLRVTAVPWEFEVASRTGVTVPQGGRVLITQRNLSMKVNDERHEMETRYAVTHPPQFGRIQRQGLKNDEKPVHVVGKVFHVVRNGQRLLTLADLCYHDPDSDFDNGQLLYTRQGISNGELVRAGDLTQKLYQLRQDDLPEGCVLFGHRGAHSACFVLLVTDGVHYTSSLLEVSAPDPYIQITNNMGLLVQRGKDSSFTAANLSVTTNQDVRTDREIKFHITWPPKHGRHDLKQGHGNFDVFNLTMEVKDTFLEVGVCVREYSQSHHHTQILHSKTLVDEEGKPVKLSRGRLQDIDDGHIHYVQTAPDQQQDCFFLDVMNGFQAVNGVEILVDIVPRRIPLEVKTFTVQEGGPKALGEDYLKIPSKYFEGLDCEFVLLKPPKHGYVENSHFPRVKLMRFTRKQVENKLICYVHDDSEELLDNFTIFANSSELGKQSFPPNSFCDC
ncbi:hypothetical protein MC885_020487 [Smutsia gigantea]|nr:hypothetical protein MC885_020487 [Smutsia gigantea]